ncbi:MAG: glucan biosynthesis protein G [Acidobacteria bacterium]|nr:glucan biosynthesis protein G [Acidobacteriota bacterium]
MPGTICRVIVLCVLLPSAACDSPAPDGAVPGSIPAPDGPPLAAETLHDDLTARARRLAAAPYEPPGDDLPPALAGLDYDQYRSIRFRPEAALWKGAARFELQLFHPGFIHREPVRLHLVEDGRITTVPFDPARFRYDGPAAPAAAAAGPATGHAGFRVHYPLNDAAIKDETAVFLGASYFRLLGRGHVHGLSSRGLAIDTALESGEEFPLFREFWLVRPAPDAAALTFHALLDSRSVAGAYRFVLEPGAPTTLDVDARLFARADVAKLGVAPLSSMFLYGRNRLRAFDDFRPQVHDSDGLLLHAADGEWIWRPLGNGPDVQLAAFTGAAPRGFGLMQRERRFESYLDAEARYDRRPSEWIEPLGADWGSGRVELLEFQVDSEFADNVAAYWVPDEPFTAGAERAYRYRLSTFDARLPDQTLAQVERTSIGRDALPGQQDPPPPSQRRIVVDFGPLPAAVVDPGGAGAPPPVEAVLDASSGQVSDLVVQPLPEARGWRAAFRLEPAAGAPAELRLYLHRGGRRVSETWNYVWHPEHVRH